MRAMAGRKSEQLSIDFSSNTIKQVNIYRDAPATESLTDGAQVKLTPTQKQALLNICNEHDLKASTILREALDFYIDLFPYRKKLQKHRRWLRETLKNRLH